MNEIYPVIDKKMLEQLCKILLHQTTIVFLSSLGRDVSDFYMKIV